MVVLLPSGWKVERGSDQSNQKKLSLETTSRYPIKIFEIYQTYKEFIQFFVFS